MPLTPLSMPPAMMFDLFPALVDGCREQHEPYRFLAVRATEQVVEAAARRGVLASLVDPLMSSVRLMLNTFEPRFVALACHILRHFLGQVATLTAGGGAKGVEVGRAVLSKVKWLVPVLVRHGGKSLAGCGHACHPAHPV